MEGYLFKKGRGQSGFLGRKNWKRRWCVLEGQYLTYYVDFDQKTQKPTEKKGMVPIRGCVVEEFKSKDKPFQFVLKHETRSPMYLSADDPKIMKTWMTACDRAAKKLHDGPVSIDFTEYYNIFGLKMEDNPTASVINRAYRKTCLKCHPDKGGDANEFKKVQEAFEILTSKLEEEEEEKLYKTIFFDAVIEKGPPGVGFGMVVVEDSKRQVVTVKESLPTMNLKSITDASKGAVNKGDILVKIGDDEITGWTLTRIVQRLNDFRVPINSDIQLRFTRRVKILDDLNIEGESGEIDEDAPAPPSHAEEADNAGPANGGGDEPPSPYGDMHDIDEDSYVPPASEQGSKQESKQGSNAHSNGNGSCFNDIDDDDENNAAGGDGNDSHTGADSQAGLDEDGPAGGGEEDALGEEEEFHLAEGEWEDAMEDPVRRATIERADEGLRSEFSDMSQTLKDVITQRDTLKYQVDKELTINIYKI
jgi:curved DNA-binding protein CbpA